MDWFSGIGSEGRNPIVWIQRQGVVDGLSPGQLDAVRRNALTTAYLLRSVGFDVRSLTQDQNTTIAQLAGSVSADLQSSARNLCEQSEAAQRSAVWDASQAAEKAIKILILRLCGIARNTHQLCRLANQAERLGSQSIDRTELAAIPSGKGATDIRYEGDVSLAAAAGAYGAALSIVKRLAFEARPDTGINFREGRFKIQRPPWFRFDARGFSQSLRQ